MVLPLNASSDKVLGDLEFMLERRDESGKSMLKPNEREAFAGAGVAGGSGFDKDRSAFGGHQNQ